MIRILELTDAELNTNTNTACHPTLANTARARVSTPPSPMSYPFHFPHSIATLLRDGDKYEIAF